MTVHKAEGRAPALWATEVDLDGDHLSELSEDYGPELIRDLVESLRDEAEADFETLAASARAGDGAVAAARLHALRGAALNLGCVGFGAAAHHLEAAAGAGRLPAPEEVAALEALLAASLDRVERGWGRP